MTKKNVALFIEALTKDQPLNEKIGGAQPTINAWTNVAKEAGYEFTDEDLFVVMRKAIEQEDIEAEKIIPAFLDAQSELDDSQLDQVSGGARSGRSTGVSVSPGTVSKVAGITGTGSEQGAWGMHVRGPFGGSYGGSAVSQ